MNREAVALGTPVFTVFEGRLGAVDEELLRDGRLRRLRSPEDLVPGRRKDATPAGADRVRRDPRILAELLLRALPGRPEPPRAS